MQGAISRRNDDDVIFLNKIEEKGWKALTSIHTLMELLDVAKDRRFLMNSVIDEWVDVTTFLRKRREMNLSSNDFERVAKEINNFLRKNRFIDFMHIDIEVWKDVREIVENSNIHSSDALHLASAIQWGCSVLVTHDRFFMKEGNRLLREAGISNHIQICDVSKIEETLGKIMH